MLPQQLQSLIRQFSRLPGIGPRQAARFAFYLLRNEDEISALGDSLKYARENIKLCDNCFLPAQNSNLSGTIPEKLLCSICISPKRDKNTICIIEKETDALSLEKTSQFQGHYYVLGGFIDPLKKDALAYERLNLLISRFTKQISNPAGSDPAGLDNRDDIEVILALTPRREGDFTSLYIEEQLKPLKEQGLKIKTTRLGRGLSSGAELEYADETTLRNALEGRK